VAQPCGDDSDRNAPQVHQRPAGMPGVMQAQVRHTSSDEQPVEDEWFAHHMIEASTRQSYSYLLDRYILPNFGGMKMRGIVPIDVRRWVLKLQDEGVSPWTIRQCKVILDAVFTTALNDLVIRLHPGKGVRTQRCRARCVRSSPPSSSMPSTTRWMTT
jgi:Phage integrase, N-terminal SAM-like domain